MITRAPGNAFESCPAATGEAQCTHFPDEAHRCGGPRQKGHYRHRCTCGFEWLSTPATADINIRTEWHVTGQPRPAFGRPSYPPYDFVWSELNSPEPRDAVLRFIQAIKDHGGWSHGPHVEHRTVTTYTTEWEPGT